MARTAVLGLPRIGPDRELKVALEDHLGRPRPQPARCSTPRARCARANWERAQAAGIDVIPSGDFSLYDHVLDTAWAVGAIPERFGGPDADGLDAYFAMARGTADAHPLEMTKWFDTNYHYLVPELRAGQAVPAARRALARAAARGRGARHRDAPGGARAGDASCCSPRGSTGRSTRSTRSCRCTSSCCASWPRPARARCSSTSRAWRSIARRRSSTRSPSASTALAAASDAELVPRDLLRRARPSARAGAGAARGRVPPRPRARAGAARAGARRAAPARRAALARRRRRPQRVADRPRPRARPDRRAPPRRSATRA